MRAVVLCGGRGLRAWPLTATVPKPLLPVDGVPLLRHLLDGLVEQGVADVVLAAGHLAGEVHAFAARLPASHRVRVVDTGPDTGTAGRLRRVRHLLGPTFLATYGDGLADVDLAALCGDHRRRARAATVTAVPLRSPYGTLDLDEDAGAVVAFSEKPVLHDRWMNGGYLVLEQDALDVHPGDDLEREVLPALAAAGQLSVHRHRGYWRSADTAKDLEELTADARRRPPPWRLARPALDPALAVEVA